MIPFSGERPSTHAAALPTAPSPTSTASPVSSQLLLGILVGVSPLSQRKVDSRTFARCSEPRHRTSLKIPPTARHAAAPAPVGFAEHPVLTGSVVESKASQPSLPAKYVVSNP